MHVVLTSAAGSRVCFDMLLPDPGLAQLSATLKGIGIEPTLFDLKLPGQTPATVLKHLRAHRADVLGLKCFDTGFQDAIALAREAKRLNPRCVTIAGGPHVSLFGEHILHVTNAFDFLVVGEGEETLPRLLSCISSREPPSNVPNLVYREGEDLVSTERSFIRDLDSLPFPDWEALRPERYLPLVILNTTRGCPHTCAFCAHNHVWGYDAGTRSCTGSYLPCVRRKSLARVVAELQRVKEQFGIRLFGVGDSLVPTKLALSLSSWLTEHHQQASWTGFAHVGQFSAEEAKLLSRSGCISLWVGVESGDEGMLQRMGKRYSRADIIQTFHDLTGAGIRAIPGFVIGFPGETEGSVANTMGLLKALQPSVYVISPFILDPGTPVARCPGRFGVQVDPDWECEIVGGDRYEFETPYYRVEGQPNDEHWRRFAPLCSYPGWYDDQNSAESEYAAVLASAMGMRPEELVASVDRALASADRDQVARIVSRAWRDTAA